MTAVVVGADRLRLGMDTLSLFSCPVTVTADVGEDGFRARLVAELVDASRTVPSWVVSNRGAAWHSAPDLAHRDAFQPVVGAILGAVRQAFDGCAGALGQDTRTLPVSYAVQLWAVVAGDGGYVTVHDHAETHWSAVYYADAGDADLERHPGSGELVLLDPRRVRGSVAGIDLFPSLFSIQPTTGMLVVFPGWLQHFSHPYRGDRPRVALSANVRLERQG